MTCPDGKVIRLGEAQQLVLDETLKNVQRQAAQNVVVVLRGPAGLAKLTHARGFQTAAIRGASERGGHHQIPGEQELQQRVAAGTH